ncbi:MAG TPA: MFS transporter [Steroidobacteraceae bacterium]|nr:MFS transporter [Steroidobacteraceae bacterium]
MSSPAESVDNRLQIVRSLAVQVRWRLVAPCLLFMLMSSLDRANVSFAAVRMNAELGFTPSQYGLGAGILFVGFLAGQYPSVLLFMRIGMRRWLCAVALLWGISAGAMAFIGSPLQLYVLRILLGVAEGGLAPGIVLYLSQFATERERATTFALPMLAIPFSVVIGGPLSGWLLEMPMVGSLRGWRWMFIAEAVPTIVLGLLALRYFPDRPRDARWLTADQQRWLHEHAAHRVDPDRSHDWSVLRLPIVWLAALLWFCLLSGAYGIIFWLPQILGTLTTLDAVMLGVVSALPWLAAAAGMYLNATHSDRTGERFWHVALPAALSGVAIYAASSVGAGMAGIALLMIGGLGLGAAQGAFWALPTRLLSKRELSLGVVTINIAGSAGGLVMPHAMGWARESSGSFALPTLLVTGVLLAAALLVPAISKLRQTPAAR